MNKWIKGLLLAALAAFFFSGLVYWDLVQRAKEAYLEGEKYSEWHVHPEKKAVFYKNHFEEEKKKLQKRHDQKKITDAEFAEKSDVLQFDEAFLNNESSIKYAYQWYKDTYELFSPPESSWVKKARVKAPQALELWKQELREKKIPFDDNMVH